MSKIPMPELPVEVTVPVPAQPDPDREAAMRAAVFYDRAKAERDDIIRLLEDSKIALQVRDNRIEELQMQLATERNRYDSLQNAFNEVLQDRADLEAVLAATQGSLEDHASRLSRFEFSRLKRKSRNGKRESVPDPQRSEEQIPDFASVLAHGKQVLGQSEDGSR